MYAHVCASVCTCVYENKDSGGSRLPSMQLYSFKMYKVKVKLPKIYRDSHPIFLLYISFFLKIKHNINQN